MSLVIEDGTGKPDAESFATAAELVIYAGKFGVTIPQTEGEQEALLRRAALQMQTMNWKGCRAHPDQALSWPRKKVEVDGEILPSTYIPARIEYGQMALAGEIYADGLDPPEKRTGPVIRERVEGAVDVQYAEVASVNRGKLLPAAPDRPSQAQFADYLAKRGLFAVRV
ncbi:DnaT-like ssDNA-binding protein [Pseudomonas sp. JS3066]|uniref:DnaT-like ssDNA-binding protein n=1 Tax=Pseudomonas sp. JS3066 TaxID=3090665 RepID=UPI002E7BF5A0|nr:DnaT-like ssDNA-binding protein [Pseudomonas sp. JS3066]WVK90892.1 DnaT-like ssDNA-binding protein [Pseudomonas sp. JS3066]